MHGTAQKNEKVSVGIIPMEIFPKIGIRRHTSKLGVDFSSGK